MDKWCWTIKNYAPSKIAAIKETPSPESWIYLHRGQKEAEIKQQTTFCLKEYSENKKTT
ncbi:MAG: hypothetical protein GX092_04375 [Clostridia bacterium]|jgi:hypothetical protein|nr:hypothetical protein [Clostridia bacterium]